MGGRGAREMRNGGGRQGRRNVGEGRPGREMSGGAGSVRSEGDEEGMMGGRQDREAG